MDDVVPTAGNKNTSNGTQNAQSPILVLPTEDRNLDGLLTCFLSILKKEVFKAPATHKLLSSLLKTNPERVTNTIRQKLVEETGDQYTVEDVDSSGTTISQSFATSAKELWALLKDTDSFPGTTQKRIEAFGRVTQIRSLPPIIALQLLSCLASHFDLERLFSTLLSQGESSGYHPYPGFKGPRNIWFFSLKYYYLSSEGQDVYPGQQSGPFHQKEPRLRIYRGSSSVALRFSDKEGAKTSAALPWRLLILSCNREHQSRSSAVRNGVEAFCWGINSELREVRRHLRTMAAQISSISVPSDNFLFDSELRESLLFENESFTNSWTYFWALQSLRLINECIASTIRNWEMYNKASFLDLLTTDGKAGANGTAPVPYLAGIEKQMIQLASMKEENNAKQEEIRALRDGLFSASSVLETRATVTQGKNVHVLTLISMVFLLASFATSIFGMQSILPLSMSLTTFAIVFACICGSAYLLILVFGGRPKGASVVWAKATRFWKLRGKIHGAIWLDKAKTVIAKKRNKPKDIEKGA